MITRIPSDSSVHLAQNGYDAHGAFVYGGISADDNATGTVLAAQDTWYQIVIFDTNDTSNGVTPDHTNDHITVATDGDYMVVMTLTAYSSQANDYEFGVFVNNGATPKDNLEVHRTTSNANAEGSAAVSGITTLSANDTVELWVHRTDGAAVSKTITLSHVSLSMVRVS